MKFKELREADLSKAQIKKVHDKADDLPKNDFIKRYGKDGDSVRFATATKMVKKELGIGEATLYLGKEYESSQFGYEATRDMKNVIDAAKKAGAKIVSQEKPSRGEPNASIEITTNNPKAVRVAIQKADSEFDIDEGFKSDAQRKAAFANGYKEKDKEKDEMFSTRSLGLKGASKRSRDKAREKDKDSEKSKKKEEVEITESVSDAQVAQIARMTDRNDHFGVRIEIARLMKDKQLMRFYDSLEKMHMTSQIQNAIGNDAVSLRGKLEKVLKVRMKQRFGDKDSKRIMDAL